MKKLLALSIVSAAFFSYSYAQKIPAYNAEKLMQRVSNKDTTYIINFWATWCIPCVHELPEFAKLYDYYKGKPVKIIMVSFDLKKDYPDKLQQYVDKKGMRQEVVWFSETDANTFIPEIDERWSGALPSTMIWDNPKGEKHIIEDEITAEQVERMLD